MGQKVIPPYSAVRQPPALPACAAVNIEIYYTRAFHHLLHMQGCTLLLNRLKKGGEQEKVKENVSLPCCVFEGCSNIL